MERVNRCCSLSAGPAAEQAKRRCARISFLICVLKLDRRAPCQTIVILTQCAMMGTQKRIGNRNARSIAAMGMREIVRCRTEPGRLCHCAAGRSPEDFVCTHRHGWRPAPHQQCISSASRAEPSAPRSSKNMSAKHPGTTTINAAYALRVAGALRALRTRCCGAPAAEDFVCSSQ
jgi:hypothetical protein